MSNSRVPPELRRNVCHDHLHESMRIGPKQEDVACDICLLYGRTTCPSYQCFVPREVIDSHGAVLRKQAEEEAALEAQTKAEQEAAAQPVQDARAAQVDVDSLLRGLTKNK